MNFIKKLVIIAVAGTFGLMALMVIIGYGTDDTDTANDKAPASVEREVPAEREVTPEVTGEVSLRTEYIDGCTSEGATRAYCECTYNYFVDNYGEDGLMDLANEYTATGVYGDEMMDAVFECAHLF